MPGVIGASQAPAAAASTENREHVRMDQEDFVLSTIPEIDEAKSLTSITPGELLC